MSAAEAASFLCEAQSRLMEDCRLRTSDIGQELAECRRALVQTQEVLLHRNQTIDGVNKETENIRDSYTRNKEVYAKAFSVLEKKTRDAEIFLEQMNDRYQVALEALQDRDKIISSQAAEIEKLKKQLAKAESRKEREVTEFEFDQMQDAFINQRINTTLKKVKNRLDSSRA